MAIINTTDVIESSIFLKSKLKKNMVGDNYYIDSLQNKINREWTYRYNLVDIDEENNIQNHYTKEKPLYTPVETVIQSVITDKGIKLADDWKKLVFKDLKHKTPLGKRFRFSLDFEKNIEYTEEEKERESSIWILVNQEEAIPTKGVVVRRCNTNFIIGGSPTNEYENITEYHMEPAIVEDDFKYINLYYNDKVNIPNAELYLTMQYNYFTKGIKINNRIVIGDVDLEDEKNNSIFKVKAVRKFMSRSTFKVGTQPSESDVALVVLALDKDTTNDSMDDFKNRIARQAPIYKIVSESFDNETEDNEEEKEENIPEIIEDNYKIVLNQGELIPTKLLQNEEITFSCELYNNNNKIENVVFTATTDLLGTTKDELYYTMETRDNNTFILTNNRPYLSNKLEIVFSCVTPNNQICTNTIQLMLGGFY